MLRLVVLLAWLVPFTFFGCGKSDGSAGDENDPAATSDEEQMQEESSEALVE